MSEYGDRLQRVYAELAKRQSRFEAATPGSLSWDFRCEVLELVEKLPKSQQELWKTRYLPSLKAAVEPLEQYQARQHDEGRSRETGAATVQDGDDNGVG